MSSTSTLRKIAASGLTLAGLTAAMPAVCPAQNSGPAMLRVTTYRVKPEMVAEWESLIKNEVAPAYKKSATPFLAVWETANFGPGNEYTAVTQLGKFAELDGPSPLSKALAPDVLGSVVMRARKCLLESRAVAGLSHPELSIMKDMQEAPVYAMVTSVQVAPGRAADFQNLVKTEVLPAYQKADVSQYWVYETVFGADAGEWTTLLLFKKYADLDGGSLLKKAMGNEGYDKFLAKTAGIVTSVRRNLIHFRADLSAMQ